MGPLIIRLLALGTAIGTALPVFTGAMADPAFVAADLIAAAALILGGVAPWRWAAPVLLVANAYALGVFSVALSGQLAEGAPNPMLLVAIGTAFAGLIGTVLKRGAQALS